MTRVEQRLALSLIRRLSKQHRAQGVPQLAILSHEHIGQQIEVFGRYENDLLTAAEELVFASADNRGCFVDVGANIGNHAIYFARLFEIVHAFEPNPTTFELLQFNTKPFRNIHCHMVALSESSSQFRIKTDRSNAGSAQLVDFGPGEATEPIIESLSLDAWASDLTYRVAAMKVDVEGHELQVLRGSRMILERDRPIVLFEQAQIDPQVFSILEDVGYDAFSYFASRIRGIDWLAPTHGRLRGLLRILLGETVTLEQVSSWVDIPNTFHSLIVALPDR